MDPVDDAAAEAEEGPYGRVEVDASVLPRPHRVELVKDIMAREQRDAYPGIKYRKRRLPELSCKEIEDIIRCVLVDLEAQVEVARRFKVTP